MKKAVWILALLMLITVSAAGAAIASNDSGFMKGLKAYNRKNYNVAIKHFRAYANSKPDPKVYYLLGYAFYMQGKFSEADEYFREAFLIDPEFSLEKVGLIKKIH
jgi:tetratricopeptide (TPR) repeat protein